MTRWHPTAGELRAIRAYAASSERRGFASIDIEVAVRIAGKELSLNLYTFGDTFEDALEFSDPRPNADWVVLLTGIDLVSGNALLDFFIFARGTGEYLSNVQAYVNTLRGKPQLVRLTSDNYRTVSGDELKKLIGE